MSNLLTNIRRASAPLQEQSTHIGSRVGRFLSATSSRVLEAAGGADADNNTLAEAISSRDGNDIADKRRSSSSASDSLSTAMREGGKTEQEEGEIGTEAAALGSHGTWQADEGAGLLAAAAASDKTSTTASSSPAGTTVDDNSSMHSSDNNNDNDKSNNKNTATLFASVSGSASSSTHGSSSMHGGILTATSSSMHGTSAHTTLPAFSDHSTETGALMRSVPYSPSSGSMASAPSPAARAGGTGLPPTVPTPTPAAAAPSPARGTTVLPFFAGMGAGGDGNDDKLVVCESRALAHLFTRIRDRNTPTQSFKFYAGRMMRILAEEGIACLESSRPFITTPTGATFSSVFVDESRVCIVSILRAGDALADAAQACIPHAPVGKVLIQRDEESQDKHPVLFYTKFPPKIATMQVLLCDPMLATGGSARMAIRAVLDAGVKESAIVFVTVVVCPEGLAALRAEYPDVTVVTGAVDDCLNERRYIVPGLGDFGDRFAVNNASPGSGALCGSSVGNTEGGQFWPKCPKQGFARCMSNANFQQYFNRLEGEAEQD